MQTPVLEPSGFGPGRDTHIGAPTHGLERLREAPPPGWATTIAIALIVAIVASGLMYWLQQSRVNDALEKQQQAVSTVARSQQQTSGSATTIQALNDRLATQVQHIRVAQRRIASLETTARHREAALFDAQSRLDTSRARITELATARRTAEHRLQQAQAARREAIARTTALIGAPLAAGRYVTKLEAFGGTQSPPMAVADLQGTSEWHVVAVSPGAEVRVFGKNGLHRVSLAQLDNMFAQSASRPNDVARSSFRISVSDGRITGITEMH
jgi:hypothetical protein